LHRGSFRQSTSKLGHVSEISFANQHPKLVPSTTSE
jgi:hypothetical protein